MPDLYIGLMSGTSLDGVDGVLVDFGAKAPRVLTGVSLPMPADLRQAFLALNRAGHDELHRSMVAAHGLTDLYGEAVTGLLAQAGVAPDQVRAIGAHGQTVRHAPPRDGSPGPCYTLQLNQPAWLAERSGIAVVADFRSRDMAAGGQGAPLVPAFHREILGRAGSAVAVANIGGIANVTALPVDGAVQGLDTGPGNALLDEWCELHTGQRFDTDGRWAAGGQAHEGLLAALLDDPYFHHNGLRSTGRDQFHLDWVRSRLAEWPNLPAQDVQATLVALTATSIAHGLQGLRWGHHPPQQLLVCGGGALNSALMQALRQALPKVAVSTTAEHGWPVMQVEAAAFAWLARQTLLGLPGNLPAVTGAAGPRVLGAVYPA